MLRLESLEQFYAAWKALAAIPKRPGKQTPEWNAAKQWLETCANQVDSARVVSVTVPVDEAVQNYRSLNQATLSIQPVDTREPDKILRHSRHGNG